MPVLLWELMFAVDMYSIKANIGRHENAFWFHSYKNQIFDLLEILNGDSGLRRSFVFQPFDHPFLLIQFRVAMCLAELS